MPWEVVVGVGALAVVVDRAMLAAEARGWVRWRRSPPGRTAVGGAMLELHSILEPEKEHVVEERARERGAIDQADDDEPED